MLVSYFSTLFWQKCSMLWSLKEKFKILELNQIKHTDWKTEDAQKHILSPLMGFTEGISVYPPEVKTSI